MPRFDHPAGDEMHRLKEQLDATRKALANALGRAQKQREALEIIAGERLALDNLMGDADIARAALKTHGTR